ncbi:MAG TPA: glycosyltransferase family 9 protein, partial [Burkholderiaceae bacterium]|nr:glycosyltransferase family 9 protein [Burkholderiaceae bacterium]
ASARKALQINPGLTDVKKFLGALLLFVGEFDEGWTLYQSPPEAVNELQEWMRLNADFSQWQGQSLNGKSLLVYCEQGLGDQIQLCRYAPILKELGAMRITVLCMKPLENLFKRVAGIDEVITGWEIVHLRKHDYWIGSFGIPLHCKTQLDTIPVSIPYLYADAMREKNMATHFADIAEFKVGICWKGSKACGRDDERSLTLEPFKKIFDLPGARFFTLMVDSRDEFFAAADKAAVDLGHEIDADAPPFEETAALIMNLDLVIACDTSIAHLAGALGKPVWIVLPFSPDWRWLEDRADSPWYPTIRLFRQRTRGDWNELFDRVAIRLQSVIVGKLPVVWPLDGD